MTRAPFAAPPTAGRSVPAGRWPSALPIAWSAIVGDRRVSLLLSVVIGAASGAVMALVIPRGPTTTGAAIGVVLASLLIGLTSGLLVRSTWVVIPVGLAQLIAFEIGRGGLDGPTIDSLRFDSVFGWLAFVAGRGLHGTLVLVPLIVGGRLGVLRATGRAAMRTPGTYLGTALVTALIVVVAWPASTPPIVDASGAPVPGSIATLERIPLGGREQTIMVRAADPDRPVLLYLSGGPGQSDLALSRVLSAGWVDDVVFVDWDQRGNGTSYGAIDPLSDMTVDQAVADTIALTEMLRERFDESKIYLMGESWGTILGVLAVKARPDLYHAWIGSGQMVDVRATDERIYDDLVADALGSGDAALLGALEAMGRPPYRDIPWSNAQVMVWYDRLYDPYTPSSGYLKRGEEAGLDGFGLLGSEYGLMDKANVLRGLIDTFAILYPQIQDLDLRREAARLEVPVVMLDGAAELDGRRDLALDWFAGLDAPTKRLVTYEGAAHSVAFEQADAVERLLVDEVIPATYEP
jgi:proline iminopeptidase